MSDYRAGDTVLVINGEEKTLRLTLGALARLEETFGDFGAMQQRLASPRIADLLIILQALLAGGGTQMSMEALKASDVDLGEAARAIGRAFASLTEAPSVRFADTSPASGGGEAAASVSYPVKRGRWPEGPEGARPAGTLRPNYRRVSPRERAEALFRKSRP